MRQPARLLPLNVEKGSRDRCAKSLREIGDQVIGVLDPDRQPDRGITDAEPLAGSLGHPGMHGGRGMAYQ